MSDPDPVPPPVPGDSASPGVSPTDVVRREELQRALAEIDRLSKDAKDHAATRSTAERQAADLQTLRKFHEKAHAEIEKLKMEKATLAAEKGDLQKRAAAAVEDRRKKEQAEAEVERLRHELKKAVEARAALEKKLEEAKGHAAKDEKAEAAPGGGGVLPETKEMPAVPPPSAVPPPESGEPKAAEPEAGEPPKADGERKSDAPLVAAEAKKSDVPHADDSRVKYTCAGCGRKLGAPPEFAGTFGTCRFCGHRMQVPAKSTR